MDINELDNAYALPVDDRIQVLNHCDTFAILNRWGNIHPKGRQIQGLYNRDTRFINCLILLLNDQQLDLLSSTITEENDILSTDLCNLSFTLPDGTVLPHGSIHIRRSQFVKDDGFHEKIEVENFLDYAVELFLSLQFKGDFADIFEVRGLHRERKGKLLAIHANGNNYIEIPYLGLDRVQRKAIVHFSTAFDQFNEDYRASFPIQLAAKQTRFLDYAIHFEEADRTSKPVQTYKRAKALLAPNLQEKNAYFPIVETSNEQFTHWIHRSRADLVSLMADTPHGRYPYAGVPWYNTAFGRDGIITALQTLWLAPDLAKDVLLFLSAYQATTADAAADAEPGKILHETRNGEMVALNEVPFKRYYGTIDATPLYILLAGEYYQRTADTETIKQIWPNICAALEWIDTYGDQDGDGFVEYHHKAENGLTNQGWKDSYDSISYANGNLAKPPIALCEVQGYVYTAKLHAAKLAKLLGDKPLAERLETESKQLRKAFNEAFWNDGINSFVLALDGDKKPCNVKSSNAGQVLFTGIAYPHRAAKLVKTLMRPELFCGWGIRTLATDEARYNPMSYHNGSVWPHDVSLIAEGFAQYGFIKEAAQLTTGLFDASLFIPLQRLPELFCGFDRRKGEGPTAYPVACSPQAWSVSSVFLLLKALLRIRIVPSQKSIYFDNPYLPTYLDWIRIKDLSVDSLKVNLEILRNKDKNHVSVKWDNQPKDWKLILVK